MDPSGEIIVHVRFFLIVRFFIFYFIKKLHSLVSTSNYSTYFLFLRFLLIKQEILIPLIIFQILDRRKKVSISFYLLSIQLVSFLIKKIFIYFNFNKKSIVQKWKICTNMKYIFFYSFHWKNIFTLNLTEISFMLIIHEIYI